MTISEILQEARDLVDASSTSLTDTTLLRRVNTAYETVVGKLIRCDGTWQFDDDNFTTSPRGVGNLASGQNTYTFTDKFLQLEEIAVLDTTGYYRKLKPYDSRSTGMSFEEFFSITYNGSSYVAQSGMPEYYDKQGNVIRFDKAPTDSYVTLTKGLRATFKRTADLFTAGQITTGTKVPGFDSQFHVILSYMIALPYAASYKKDRVPIFEKKISDLEKDMIIHYSSKEKDAPKRLSIQEECYM